MGSVIEAPPRDDGCPLSELSSPHRFPVLLREAALIAWFREQGGCIAGAVLGQHNGLRGVWASRDLAPGEVVLRVPRHLLLTVESARRSAIGRHLNDSATNDPHSVIGAYLVHLRRHGGPWRPMVDAVPAHFDTRPDRYAHADWALLHGSATQALARRYWLRMLREFRRVKAALPRPQRIPLRDFLWGYQASATRTFRLTIDGVDTAAMVPCADMLNHAADPSCEWSGDHTRHVEVRTRRRVSAGSPLEISYGDTPNSHLLAHYGFCLDDNPHDTVRLTERVPGPDVAAEQAALRRLIVDGERALAGFTCGVDEDDALLARPTLTPAQRDAVTVRRGEKRVLLQTLVLAHDALAALGRPDAERDAALALRIRAGGPWSRYFVQLRESLATGAEASPATQRLRSAIHGLACRRHDDRASP